MATTAAEAQNAAEAVASGAASAPKPPTPPKADPVEAKTATSTSTNTNTQVQAKAQGAGGNKIGPKATSGGITMPKIGSGRHDVHGWVTPRDVAPIQPSPDRLPRGFIPQRVANPIGRFMHRVTTRTLPFMAAGLAVVAFIGQSGNSIKKKQIQDDFGI